MSQPNSVAAPACPVCAASTERLTPVETHPLSRCTDCELEFLHPQPSEAELDSIYGRHYYEAWGVEQNEAAVRALKMATFRRRIADVRILLPEHARVLDVGCATGYFLEAAKESGLRPYGVELSAYGADACRQKVDPGHVYQGTLEDSRFDIPSEPGFDAIFMSDLLEHVRNPCTTLAAARSSLKPSGLLVITTPWTESFSHRAMGRHWLHYKPEHLYYFGIKSLGRMLQASGFDIIRVNSARKCLSLEYARNQFAAGGYQMRFLARLLNRFPTSLLNRHLWVRIGEATIVARPHEELTHAATRH